MLDTHARRFVEPVILEFARRLHARKVTADAVTWAALLVGVGAGALTWAGHPWLAVLALWLSGFLDAVDGSLARLSDASSAWGTVLDVTFDRVVELSVLFALAVLYPDARLALVGLVSTIVVGMTVFLTVGAVTEKKGVKSFYYQAGVGERTEGFVLLTAMLVFQERYLTETTLVFVLMMLVTIFQRLSEARRILR